jgi:anaerobic selenocysteine-containing dehydrogenase
MAEHFGPNRVLYPNRGAIVAEWVITLPAIGVALAVIVGGISLTVDRGRLHHAAADAQRIHSYGGSQAEMTTHVQSVLQSSDASVSVGEGPAPHTSCVTVARPIASWVGDLLALPREATSCGLVVPR